MASACRASPRIARAFPGLPSVLDPATSNPVVSFGYQTEPSLGFDASHNFYYMTAYHNAADLATSSSGALVLQKYDFSGSLPIQQDFAGNLTPRGLNFGFGSGDTNIIYGWNASSFRHDRPAHDAGG